MELIRCFKALSDNTRLRLLYVLKRYELNVNEIVKIIDMIQSGISRHLKILMESGLITSRRDGSFIYYSAVESENLDPLHAMLDTHLASNKTCLKDLEKSAQMITIRHDRTKRFFKTVAPQWDRLKKEVLGDFNLNARISGMLPAHGHIADLGCGTGELLEVLSGREDGKLIGIDSSPEMLEQARLRLSGFENTELRLGEVEHLPMRNKEIDTAVMSMVLHHIPQPKQPIHEVRRALKPGGLFILADFNKHKNEGIKQIIGGEWLGFQPDDIIGWLTQEGFDEITNESFTVNHGMVITVYTATKK
jgi:SAM-dependent methyltransferase